MADWWHKRRVERRPDTIALPGRVLYLADDPGVIRAQLAGTDLDPGAAPPLRHDVSTDEIAPARACYHFDEALGEFPYTGLTCRGERPVPPGSVKAGGFVASVSGRRRGKGSSREAAPFAEMSAGIRLAVAESFERIYEANCVNLGLLTTTDSSLLARLAAGRGAPLSAFTSGRDPISAEIVRFGGLFPYNVARFQGTVAPPAIVTEPRPMTLAEKILAAHVRQPGPPVRAVAPGDASFVTADWRFSHEYVTPMAAAFWDNAVGPDVPLTDAGSVLLFRDHLSLLAAVAAADGATAGELALAERLAAHQEAFARRAGLTLHGDARGGGSEGICHALMLERYALPGQVVLGADSHTCQAGALGCLAFGCGTTELFNAWFTRDVRLAVPPTVRVELVGRPAADVSAKDVMLLLLAREEVRRGGAIGAVLDFGGEAVLAMDVDERATLTNMAAEAGAFSGIVTPDARAVEFLVTRRGLHPAEAARLVEGLASDPDCAYARVIRLDLAELEPMVATPGDPGNGRPARDVEGQRIDIAYCGSCTAGTRGDLDTVAAVLAWGAARGLRRADGVRFYVQCGSQDVLEHCASRGYLELFHRVGAELVPPSCGACINAGPGVSRRADEVTVSAVNRNFPGRSGPGRVFLASPSTVAASALAGSIYTWPSLRRRLDG